MVSPMVASDEPSARLMLFWRSFLRAAETAATPSGSRIRSATRSPAKAGGAPILAATASTTSGNFLASKHDRQQRNRQQHDAEHQGPARRMRLARPAPERFRPTQASD